MGLWLQRPCQLNLRGFMFCMPFLCCCHGDERGTILGAVSVLLSRRREGNNFRSRVSVVDTAKRGGQS